MICVSLTACTTQWVPTTGNPTPFYEASQTCHETASKLFPVKNEVAQRSILKTVRQSCVNGVECGKKGYYNQSVPVTESYVIDVNRDSRNHYYDSCMQQKGWKQKIKYLF
ncbi:hypothetical protein XNC1_2660 [Xenorhabdus nematophila ATCC 19061]|uniref:Lipoprotein n=1 Tax=Xenorhabdus nematophila (strain ATCC 19061 / DSM 3370 / CCUG 14189 / LMG 1036 / NCIMB 9965 / AN6) TaxID=406817 RepID=D3VI74_XENNA|nr:hypothetical protein XNC1_2660 [Xenorhabdus nematophila ATCC 19061]